MLPKLKKLALFLWENFGPLLVFQLIYRVAGYRVATEAAMLTAVGECLWLWRKKQKPTQIFVMSTALCLVFGTLDLYLNSATFGLYEAPIINLFVAAVFALSLRNEKSIVQELAEKKKDMGHLEAGDRRYFFGAFTLLWAAYYVARATAFLWINSHTEMGDAFWLRLLVGKLSLLAMIGFSIVGGRPLYILATKWRLLPSQRRAVIS